MALQSSYLLLLAFIIQGFFLGIEARAHRQLQSQERVDFVCPTDGFFPMSPDACSATYYLCLSGVATEQRCPIVDYVFDPANGRCVPYNAASCRGPVTNTPTNTPTTISTTTQFTTVTVPGGFTCPSSEGFYPIPGQCTNQYYTCLGGQAYISYCPPNSLFDPILGVCVAEEFVSCRTTTPGITTTPISTPINPITTTVVTAPISTTVTIPGTCSGSSSFVCPTDGIHPIPGATCCNKFYKCSNRTPYVFQCPSVTIFNPSLLVCDWNYNLPECAATRPPFFRNLL